jgi:hypothetical protein
VSEPVTQYPRSVKEAVDQLYANLSLNDEVRLATMNEEDLIDVHSSLGHRIRNEFGLWKGNNALLESCRIRSDRQDIHIDDASMIIVKALWSKVKKQNVLQD